MHERRNDGDVTLDELIGRLAPCDLVLIEGFKQEPVPKLEVYRPENGKLPLFPERSDIVAVATDAEIETSLPKLPLNDIGAIADFVMKTLQLQERPC
jgi:molybdopterin-guanine dinucleotide biosynthesis protein B